MLEAKFGEMLDAHNMLGTFCQGIIFNQAHNQTTGIQKDQFDLLIDAAKLLRDRGEKLEFDVVVLASGEVIKHMESIGMPGEAIIVLGSVEYANLISRLQYLSGLVRDSFKSRVGFLLPAGSGAYFGEKAPLFGAAVTAKFPSIVYEIDEASKCIALERSTAAAFHSIRCLEAGIRALSRCLAIPDPAKAAGRTWGKVLKAIKDEAERRWPPALPRTGNDDALFDNAYAALAGMQNPWRNSTMHLEAKYTLEEARDIFNGVGAFMRKLASRMDEQGLPLA